MTDTAENMHYSAEYDSVLPDSTAFLRGLAKMSSGHFYSVCGYRHVRPSGAGNWLLFFTLDGRGRIQQPGLRTDALPGDIHLLGPDAYSDYGVPPSEKQKPVPLSKAGSYSNFVRQLHHGQSRPRRSPASFWEFHYIHFLPKEELLPLLNLPDIGAGLGHVRIARPGDRQRIVDAFQRIHRDLIFGNDLTYPERSPCSGGLAAIQIMVDFDLFQDLEQATDMVKVWMGRNDNVDVTNALFSKEGENDPTSSVEPSSADPSID